MSEELTVLVVDDQPPNLRLMEAMLSPRGHQVVTAASGEEALACLAETSVDLVLLDIMMPGIDGSRSASASAPTRRPPSSRW